MSTFVSADVKLYAADKGAEGLLLQFGADPKIHDSVRIHVLIFFYNKLFKLDIQTLIIFLRALLAAHNGHLKTVEILIEADLDLYHANFVI